MVVLVGACVTANVAWMNTYRRGLPYDIDEAGYLLRAVEYSQAIHASGISGFFDFWTRPDIIGPLLPAVAGIVRAFADPSLFALLDLQQVFYGLMVIATFLLARKLLSLPLALLASVVVACSPGAIGASHLFLLAEPASALFTLLLVAQVRAGGFERLSASLIWGLVLGLTTLTRSMMLSLVAAPVAVAVASVVVAGLTRRRLLHLLAGLAIAAVSAGTWWYHSLSPVLHYLTTYGYGQQAGSYASHRSTLSWSWIVARASNIAQQDLFAPMLIVLIAWFVAGMAAVVVHRTAHRRDRTGQSSATSPTRLARVRRLFGKVGAQVLGTEAGVLAAVLVVAYAILSSSRNSGSYFELPLLPVVVVLALAVGSRMPRVLLPTIGLATVVVCAITLLNQLGVIKVQASRASLNLGPVHLPAFNDTSADFTGPKLQTADLGGAWWGDCGEATISCFYGRRVAIDLGYISTWTPLGQHVEDFLYSYARDHGRSPVVFFAYQGPLFNTNTVALAAQLQHRSLPVGALNFPYLDHGTTLNQQLELPQYGQPNFVIAASPARSDYKGVTGAASSVTLLHQIVSVLRKNGFTPVKTFPIDAAHDVVVWWKAR